MVKYVKIVCANAQYCNLYCHEGHGTYWESFKVWLVAALVLICLNRSQGICHPILVPWSETKNGPREMSPAEPPEEIQQSGSAFLFSAFFCCRFDNSFEVWVVETRRVERVNVWKSWRKECLDESIFEIFYAPCFGRRGA